MGIAAAGLILITVAWFTQLYFLFKGNKEMQPVFVVTYMIGVLLLVLNGYISYGVMGARFELAALIASGIVLLKLVAAK
ncbi:MAG: hypothetical protein WBC74_05210 [Candidatus Omnitrophota bacterium]